MSTENISVNTSWSQIADSDATDLLVTWDTPGIVEFATTLENEARIFFGLPTKEEEESSLKG